MGAAHEKTIDDYSADYTKSMREFYAMQSSYDTDRSTKLREKAKELYSAAGKIMEIRNIKSLDYIVDNIFTPYAGVLTPFVRERGSFGLNGRALLQLFMPSCPHCVTMAGILEEAMSPFPQGLAYGLDVSCLGDPSCELAKYIQSTFLDTRLWDGRVPAFYSMALQNDQLVYAPFILASNLDREATIDRLRQSVLAVEMAEYSSLVSSIGQRDVLNGQIRGLRDSLEDHDEFRQSLQPVEEMSVASAWANLRDPATIRSNTMAKALNDSVNALQSAVRDDRQRGMINQTNLIPSVLGGVYNQLSRRASEGLQGDTGLARYLQMLQTQRGVGGLGMYGL